MRPCFHCGVDDDGQPPSHMVFVHPIVLTEHVFDKVRSIDMTLAEFNTLLTAHGVRSSKTDGAQHYQSDNHVLSSRGTKAAQ